MCLENLEKTDFLMNKVDFLMTKRQNIIVKNDQN